MDNALQWVGLVASLIGIAGGTSNVARLVWGSQWFKNRRKMTHSSPVAASAVVQAATVDVHPTTAPASDHSIVSNSQPGIIRTAGAQGGQLPLTSAMPQATPAFYASPASQPLAPMPAMPAMPTAMPAPSQPLPYSSAPSRPLPYGQAPSQPLPQPLPVPRRSSVHYPGLTRLAATGIIAYYAALVGYFISFLVVGSTYSPNTTSTANAVATGFNCLTFIGLLGAFVSIVVAIVWSSVLATEAKQPAWLWVTILVSLVTIWGLGALIFAIWGPLPQRQVYAYAPTPMPVGAQQRRP